MGFIVNTKTVNYFEKACNYVKHSGVFNPKKFGINSIHGINPGVTFPATGKSADLPRFITEEMATARKMNQAAVRQIKQPIERSFLKSTAEDFRRLTDTSYEASNLRCAFTNPESGEVFHLLSEGKTKEGLNIIRVLDKDGAYLKTINVKPKKVVILDDYKYTKVGENIGYTGGWAKSMAHGDLVEVMARRNNPFADYEIIRIHSDELKYKMSTQKLERALEDLQKRIDSGEQIDFLSCSFGRVVHKSQVKQFAKSRNMTLSELKHQPMQNVPILEDFKLLSSFKEKNPNVRIIESAGNDGEDFLHIGLIAGDCEGVSSLSSKGKLSNFSSSRNSLYSQHMELGEYEYTATPYGYSLTGGISTEIPFTDKIDSKILRQHCSKPNLFTDAEKVHIKELKSQVEAETPPKDDFSDFGSFNIFDSELSEKVSPAQKELDAYLEKLYFDKGRLAEAKHSGSDYEMHLPNPLDYMGLSPHKTIPYVVDANGNAMLCVPGLSKEHTTLCGTSFSCPTRTAKLALWDMLKDLL